MKGVGSRLWLLAVLGFVTGCGASLGGSPPKPPKNPLVGTWKGKDPFGQSMELRLKDDGRLMLVVTNRRGTFNKYGTFTVDTSHSPAHINLKLNDRGEIRTICKLIDEKHLAFESINSSDPRPKRFGDGRILFERQ